MNIENDKFEGRLTARELNAQRMIEGLEVKVEGMRKDREEERLLALSHEAQNGKERESPELPEGVKEEIMEIKQGLQRMQLAMLRMAEAAKTDPGEVKIGGVTRKQHKRIAIEAEEEGLLFPSTVITSQALDKAYEKPSQKMLDELMARFC